MYHDAAEIAASRFGVWSEEDAAAVTPQDVEWQVAEKTQTADKT
jgi:hypothetical protein